MWFGSVLLVGLDHWEWRTKPIEKRGRWSR